MTNHDTDQLRPRLSAVGGLALSLLLATGCRIPPRQDPGAEDAVARAVALGGGITFRAEGGPIDEPAVGETLTRSDATRRAVMTDPRLQAALARVRIAMADADQSRLLPNPVLDLVLRWGPGSPNVEVAVTQEIFDAFQIPTRSSSADNRMRQAVSEAVTVALDVTAEVQEAYSALQASERLIAVLDTGLDPLSRLVEVAKKRLDAGEGVRGDITVLDAQRVGLEVGIATARIRAREERLKLARLVGEPSGGAHWKLDPWRAPGEVSSAESAWIATALKNRPEVQAIVWRLAALGDEYALTSLLPWDGASAGIDAQKGDDYFAGPSLSAPLPLFDTGDVRRARATAAQIEARHDLTLSRRRVVEEVRVAHHSFSGNVANLARVREQLVPLQQLRRDQAEQAYRAGQTDITPLFLAEQSLRATQADVVGIEREAALALLRLQRAAGGPTAATEASK